MLRIDLPVPVTSADPPDGRERAPAVPVANSVAAPEAVESHVPLHDTARPGLPPTAIPDQVAFAGEQSGSLPAEVSAFVHARSQNEGDAWTSKWLQSTKTKLRLALRGYGLDCEIIGDRLTPNAALIRFRGTDRMTVDEVDKRRKVLLTSHGLDVIGVRPEKGEVVVIVAREKRAVLDLRAAWGARALPGTAPERNTSFVVGEKENDGRLLYLNLGGAFADQPMHGPHTLIAGETGGGKGVLTRNLILDIGATNVPTSARIRLIDPKSGGDYPWIGRMPHVDGGLISTQAEAVDVLKELVATMETRYAQITPVAPNIDRYNAKVAPDHRLPRIYLFHDELGDWMADKDNADYREAVEGYVVRLASKARAAGIHLFLITQRPDKDALPGQIKANMNNKICLRVSSQTNSRIVLDENGAETLLGHGHFAAKLANERPSNQSSLIFGQAPFMDDDEAHELAHLIANHWR